MRSDTGPFALVPVWVLDLPISHLALRVYAVHADWADRQGAHFHGRRQIAERLGVSVRAVDDAHKSLVHHRALRIEHRRDAAGDPTSNRYVVVRAIQGVAKQGTLPSEPGEATGNEAGFALTRTSSNQNPPTPRGARDGTPPRPSASASLRDWTPTESEPIDNDEKARVLADLRRLRKRDPA